MTLKVFEAFAGVGTQRMALRNLGIDHVTVGISEIDPFALQSYEAIHGKTMNYGDITKINPLELPDFDLFTYSFPCQDLSSAGSQQGMVRGQTRSGLLYECEKIIEMKRPKYLLLENVKPLVGKKFKPYFDEWLIYLENLGYTNYWQVLNASEFGSGQRRERVFVVSILGDHAPFSFPTPSSPRRFIKDCLLDESEVPTDAYSTNPIALTNGTCFFDAYFPNRKPFQTNRIYHIDRLCPTLTKRGDNYFLIPTTENPVNESDYRVRRIQPIEMWRLMGISDEDYFKAYHSGVSKTHLKHQAGNAICVEVLEAIFKSLFLNEVN